MGTYNERGYQMSIQKLPKPILVMTAEQIAACSYAKNTLVNYRSIAKNSGDIDTVLKITHAIFIRKMAAKNE